MPTRRTPLPVLPDRSAAAATTVQHGARGSTTVVSGSIANPWGRFAKIELSRDKVPDETTILRFRRPLEAHDLTRAIV
jgi:hypothetical protein